MTVLEQLHAEIAARVNSIRAEYPDWPCRRGCDGCCHRLAEIPQLTSAEWALLQTGLATLPWDIRQAIRGNMAALETQQSRPLVCPLLDQTTGACRVYSYRPIACRTYGFYLQRGKGLFCKDIESQVNSGVLSEVVWGNQDAIDQRLKGAGETRELTSWFSDGVETEPSGRR